MMRLPWRALLLVLGFGLFGAGAAMLVLWFSSAGSAPPELAPTTRRLTVQSLAPDFVLESADGKGPIALREFAGKRVLINFWATWCGPCEQETPDLVAAYKTLRANGGGDIEFIGVASRDSAPKVRDFVQRFGVPYTILLDDTGLIGDAYNVVGMPYSVYVGADGKIARQVIGMVTTESVINQFKAMEPSK